MVIKEKVTSNPTSLFSLFTFSISAYASTTRNCHGLLRITDKRMETDAIRYYPFIRFAAGNPLKAIRYPFPFLFAFNSFNSFSNSSFSFFNLTTSSCASAATWAGFLVSWPHT